MPAARLRTVALPFVGLLGLGSAGLAMSLPGTDPHRPTPTATVIEATVVPPGVGAVAPRLELRDVAGPLPPGDVAPGPELRVVDGPLPPGAADLGADAVYAPDPVEDAADDGEAQDAAEDEPAYEADDGELIDAERIRTYLEGRGAPLAEHADTLVAAGVEHDVDPRLVVAIAVAESSGGERLPPGTYNAWGWSGTGSHGLKSWASWEESIPDFTGRLAELYDVDDVDADFAQTYVPPNWRWWLDTVHAVMAEM